MHFLARHARARRALAVVGFIAILGATGARVTPVPATSSQRAIGPSNVVFVLADDLDLASMKYMPHTRHLIGDRGATFDNYFVSDSLCCPSRATTLRGQYAHNTGVHANAGKDGGFETAYLLGIEHDTYAVRVQGVGYATGFFGKYLNHYPGKASPTYIPPGWDSWASAISGKPYSEFNYTLNVDGQPVHYGYRASDYGTEVYFRHARSFMDQAHDEDRRFFAAINVYAPHMPSTPAPRDAALFLHLRAPRTPAFDLADVTGQPAFIRDLPQFTRPEMKAIDHLYRLRLQSIQDVDREVARLVRHLRREHELRRTYIVFASDNGFHLGQHRLPSGKETAYDTDIHVPLLVRGPGIRPGMHVHRLALNNDLAPTFDDIAGVPAAGFTDGRSLLPVLLGEHRASGAARRAILIEHWAEVSANGVVRPTNSENRPDEEPQDADQFDPRLNPDRIVGPYPLQDRTILGRLRIIPEYRAVRTRHHLYVEYATGERELYDLDHDPDEIHNLAGTMPALERRLATRLDALKRCRAAGCRDAEDRPTA